ncbi:MAG: TIGR00341 family protein, partial [Planctomycetota bacterium]
MPARLINVYVNAEDAEDRLPGLREELETLKVQWWEDLELFQVLTDTSDSEKVLDCFQKRLDGRAEPRIVVLPVEATLPAPKLPPPVSEAPLLEAGARISRQELYQDVAAGVGVTKTYLALIVLSVIVAAIGLVRDSVAIVIGAMVLAPLLGPNVGVALATTLGDIKLGVRSVQTTGLGVLISIALAIAMGAILQAQPEGSELVGRTTVSLADVALALAAGVGAAMSFTSALSSSLLGVMVAVALMPPTVAFGLLLGGGHPSDAMGALLLLATNVVCVNLAAVSTFWAQGIRPAQMWEADRAARATRRAICAWALLVAGVVALILIARKTDRTAAAMVPERPPA